ncbi:DUF4307 domain-containing protein [Nocardia aurantia]|uniref:DUF4307 domain-containing protein n=1 Tax=Nocardia aurantia TaxID=2585199 RepID=A0A7K0DT11_9NOCA|nr:DUF4307 domain-containing protein [Nocardia aurantia]MQY28492.1 hypothetical protein [Nocardia aurantia]
MNETTPEFDPAAEPVRRVADRYGNAGRPGARGTGPRRRRRIPFVLGAVVVLLGLLVAYVGYRQFGPKDIQPDELGYSVVNDSTVDVHFTVTRTHPERPAVCFVRAMDADGNELGRREVLIPPSSSGTVEVNVPVRGTARPANGNVYGCGGNVPAYLKAG